MVPGPGAPGQQAGFSTHAAPQPPTAWCRRSPRSHTGRYLAFRMAAPAPLFAIDRRLLVVAALGMHWRERAPARPCCRCNRVPRRTGRLHRRAVLFRLACMIPLGLWRSLRGVVAGVMLFFITPGAVELVEDVVHFVAHGDTFHDTDHDAEHCCSGAFHFCSCHPRTVAAPSSATAPSVVVPRAWHEWRRSAWPAAALDDGPADEYSQELSRPPAA